jgi:hypothetical protein
VLSVYFWVQVVWGRTQLFAGEVQVFPVKSQESPGFAVQLALLVQAVPAFLQVPPQSLTVLQVLLGLSEQTLGGMGQSEALLQPPVGVVPIAQVPPDVAYGQSMSALQVVVLFEQRPDLQSALVAQVTLPYLHISCCVHFLLVLLQAEPVALQVPEVRGGQSLLTKHDSPVLHLPATGAQSVFVTQGSHPTWQVLVWQSLSVAHPLPLTLQVPTDPPRQLTPLSQSTPTSVVVLKVPPGTPVREPEVSSTISMFGLWICRVMRLRGLTSAWAARGAITASNWA